MREKPAALTDLPPSPEDEQRSRFIRYGIMMGIRTGCVIACLFMRDWWVIVPALGAIFLPYVAVVFANTVSRRGTRRALRPGALVRRESP